LNTLSSAAVLPDALAGLWPKGDQGVKLADLYSWFDGSHAYEEETQPGYPAESRPIPRVDYNIVKKAVSKAIQDGALWLVYGNDSVFQDAPTAIQLDADAMLYRPPASLAAIDLLPTALAGAWSAESEPKTTVSSLYADLKAKRGKPWPPKAFIDSLNAALGQGFLHRDNGSGPVTSLRQDGSVGLTIRTETPKPPEPVQMVPGRRASSAAVLSIAEIQELADQVHALTKPLAGLEPQVEVRIFVSNRAGGDLSAANKILDKIKAGWKL